MQSLIASPITYSSEYRLSLSHAVGGEEGIVCDASRPRRGIQSALTGPHLAATAVPNCSLAYGAV